jgi:hypothetical protein
VSLRLRKESTSGAAAGRRATEQTFPTPSAIEAGIPVVRQETRSVLTGDRQSVTELGAESAATTPINADLFKSTIMDSQQLISRTDLLK